MGFIDIIFSHLFIPLIVRSSKNWSFDRSFNLSCSVFISLFSALNTFIYSSLSCKTCGK
nr:MAG TPA: hypothetical protein [Caudoviricetes sp.]